MSISRKRSKELKKLRKLANSVLEEQREVLGHAGVVLAETGTQARKLSDEHVAPRVAKAYGAVSPAVNRSLRRLQRLTDKVGDRISPATAAVGDAVSPYAGAAVEKALNAAKKSGNKKLEKAIKKFGNDSGLLKSKRCAFLKGLGIFAGVAAAAAVGYSLWEAFRDDEDVWVAPESE